MHRTYIEFISTCDVCLIFSLRCISHLCRHAVYIALVECHIHRIWSLRVLHPPELQSDSCWMQYKLHSGQCDVYLIFKHLIYVSFLESHLLYKRDAKHGKSLAQHGKISIQAHHPTHNDDDYEERRKALRTSPERPTRPWGRSQPRTHARRSTTSSSPQFVLVARCPEKRNTERQQRNSSRIRSQERRERSPPLLPSEEPEPQPRRDSRLVGRLMGHGPPRRRRHAGPSHVDNMELR